MSCVLGAGGTASCEGGRARVGFTWLIVYVCCVRVQHPVSLRDCVYAARSVSCFLSGHTPRVPCSVCFVLH